MKMPRCIEFAGSIATSLQGLKERETSWASAVQGAHWTGSRAPGIQFHGWHSDLLGVQQHWVHSESWEKKSETLPLISPSVRC